MQIIHSDLSRSVVALRWDEGLEGGSIMGRGNLWTIDMFIILIVLMITQACTFVKAYPIVYFKYVQFMSIILK